jgi:hypothetical protein
LAHVISWQFAIKIKIHDKYKNLAFVFILIFAWQQLAFDPFLCFMMEEEIVARPFEFDIQNERQSFGEKNFKGEGKIIHSFPIH